MLALLAIAVMAVSTAYGQQAPGLFLSQNDVARCDGSSGVEFYDPKWLCGKKFYATFFTGKADHANCGVGQALCKTDGTIVVTTKTYVDEKLNRTSTSTLQNLGNGKVLRTYDTANGPLPLNEVVHYWKDFNNGDFELIFTVCSDVSISADNVKLILISSLKSADFSQQINSLKKLYPNTRINSIPNNCNVDKIFP